jgi:hypothetical protein
MRHGISALPPVILPDDSHLTIVALLSKWLGILVVFGSVFQLIKQCIQLIENSHMFSGGFVATRQTLGF